LPLVLWIQRRLGLRGDDRFPTAGEIAVHVAVWAFIAEVAGPWLLRRGTADWRDALMYASGGLVAAVLWRWGGNFTLRRSRNTLTSSP
jgi:hypothetical protein